MEAKMNSGGPAFPTTADADNWGMTLRDYFAAHAPITLDDARSAWRSAESKSGSPTYEELVQVLVALRSIYAETMIAARGAA